MHRVVVRQFLRLKVIPFKCGLWETHFKEKAVETEHSQLTDAIRIGVDGFFPLHVADHLGILQFC